MEEPIRILSDLHLAHPASKVDRVEALRPLLAGARTVIFNGDTCEQSCWEWREQGDEALVALKDLCAEEGVTPVFLPGNHDPEIADRGWLELAGGAVFITHGHALYPEVAPWSHEFLFRKDEVWNLVEERRRVGTDLSHHWETTRLVTEILKPKVARKLGKKGGNFLLSALWPPERCYNILRVWLTMVATADQFAQRHRPQAKLFLFGHFHRPGVWPRGSRSIINTGAFMRGAQPLVGELRDGWFRLRAVEQGGGEFRLGAARSTMRISE
jgi:predicted phosphodiesterase